MYPPFNDYARGIENETWSSLARMAITFKVNIKENGRESRRLKKEIEMIKQVLYEQLRHYEENGGAVNSSFYVGMFKTIRYVEGCFERAGIADRTFIYFLKALLYKTKKKRLVAVKPLERVFEFRRMKKFGDRYDYLRRTDKD